MHVNWCTALEVFSFLADTFPHQYNSSDLLPHHHKSQLHPDYVAAYLFRYGSSKMHSLFSPPVSEMV